MFGRFGNQLPITVASWSQCLTNNCGYYGPQFTVDAQIWNPTFLASGKSQMVLAGASPASFVTFRVQDIVAKVVVYTRKTNAPGWYTNLGSSLVFHNSSTVGLASSFQPGNVTQNVSWQLDMCPDSGGIVNPAACPCFAGTFTFQCPAACPLIPSNNSALWSFLCAAGSYKASACASACTLCPAGRYGNAVGLTSSSCTGPCSAGHYCVAGSTSATQQECPSGTFTSATGSVSAASCQQCPGGHFCPAGTVSWAHLNCGRGSYCPSGSGAPQPCPYQVPPAGGWGALEVQGPAFHVETAQCLNHCFWNFTSGDGALSKC